MVQNRVKKVSSDLVFSFAALALWQGSLQFIIYPLVNKQFGNEVFGNILYIYSFIAIFSVAIGGSANNFRMVTKEKSTNGDFLYSIIILTIPCSAIFMAIVYQRMNSPIYLLGTTAILIFTILRYYSTADFWINKDFKKYFIYYCFIVGGYLAGLGIVLAGGSWIWIFLAGESICLLYVLYRKNIYTKPLQISDNKNRILKGVIALFGANLLYNVFVNLDRTLLLHLMDANAVTVYYVASLIGRMFALVVGPINGIILAYLSKNDKLLSRRKFVIMICVASGLSILFYLVTIVITPLFIQLLYPTVYDDAINIYMMTNASQIVCFAGSLILVTLLTFTHEKYQIIIQSVCAAVFIGLAIVLTNKIGLLGFVCAGLAANVLRFIMAIAIGIYSIKDTTTDSENTI